MSTSTPVTFDAAAANKMLRDVITGVPKMEGELLWAIIKPFLPYIIGAVCFGAVLLVILIILVPLFREVISGTGCRVSQNGFTPSMNRFIGSLAYLVAHTSVILISFKIWGVDMLEEPWSYMLHLIAFSFVRVLLLLTGVWVY